jgi:hypothetical protein
VPIALHTLAHGRNVSTVEHCFVLLIKSETRVIEDASPFAEMRDAPY